MVGGNPTVPEGLMTNLCSVNCRFYGSEDIRAFEILSGRVPCPPECSVLYEVLNKHEEMAERAFVEMAKEKALKRSNSSASANSSSKFQVKQTKKCKFHSNT